MHKMIFFIVLFTSTLFGETFTIQSRINPNCWSTRENNKQSDILTLKENSAPTTLKRLPGQSWGWPCGCWMCLGNHLINNHNLEGYYINPSLQATGYLNSIGYNQWQILHDNLHNNSNFSDHIPTKNQPVSVFAPTPMDVVIASLEIAKLSNEDVIYDLGCGDGRVLVAASKIYKCRSVGIDIDPLWITKSQENITLNKIDDLCRVYEKDVLEVDFEKYATVVFIYLLPDLSEKLIPKLKQLPKGSKVIFHDKPAPGLTYKEFNIISSSDNKSHKIYFWTP